MRKIALTITAVLLAMALFMAWRSVAPAYAPEVEADRHHLLYGEVVPDPTVAPYGEPGDLYTCLSCHEVDDETGEILVERDCSACHTADMHHLFYGSVTPEGTAAPNGVPGESTVCLSCHEVVTSADGYQFVVERDCRVCHQPAAVETVVVDIKPSQIRLDTKGDMEVDLRGSQRVDISEIDVSSILMEGIAPPKWAKIRGPAKGEKDLVLKFSAESVRQALGNLEPGKDYDVWFLGAKHDGTLIAGSDWVHLEDSTKTRPGQGKSTGRK